MPKLCLFQVEEARAALGQSETMADEVRAAKEAEVAVLVAQLEEAGEREEALKVLPSLSFCRSRSTSVSFSL